MTGGHRVTATRPRRTLTPVTVTARYPSLRSGRPEDWSSCLR